MTRSVMRLVDFSVSSSWCMEKNLLRVVQSYYAKYRAMKLMNFMTASAVRFFGAYGLVDKHLVGRDYRDTVTANIMVVHIRNARFNHRT